MGEQDEFVRTASVADAFGEVRAFAIAGANTHLEVANVRLCRQHPWWQMRVVALAPRCREETVRTSDGREALVVVVEILQHCRAPVLHVVETMGLAGFFPCRAEHGEQDRRQNGDYRYHHEQLNKGKAYTIRQSR